MITWLNLYQKPRLGNGYLFRYPAYRYKHKISAMGGFDTASCELALNLAQAEAVLEQWIGNRVAFYMDNAVEPIWEGLVSRITYTFGAAEFTSSLDQLANKTRVIFSQRNVALTTQITTAVEDTASQAIYGIKEFTFDSGATDNTNVDVTNKTAKARMELALRAYPRASTRIRSGGGGGMGLVRIECVGIYKTLEWETYSINAAGPTGVVGASTAITRILSTSGAIGERIRNQATFFDNADVTQVVTNAATNWPIDNAGGKTVWQAIQSITEPGDSTSAAAGVRWVAGVMPTDPNLGTRRFYYRPAVSTIGYIVRLRDGTGYVRNTLGAVVPPQWVRPDIGVRMVDALVGWFGNTVDDPREFYLNTVEYDADKQSVSMSSEDDISIEGAFQLAKFSKAQGTRFGSPTRQTI